MRNVLLALTLALPASAGALDFRSTARPAILYDAPSVAAARLAVAGAGVPFELVVETADWVKVRDHTGRLAWLEKAALGSARTVSVKTDTAQARREPRADAAPAFAAARGVVLQLTPRTDASPPGWLAVRHASGVAGWLRADEVWGE